MPLLLAPVTFSSLGNTVFLTILTLDTMFILSVTCKYTCQTERAKREERLAVVAQASNPNSREAEATDLSLKPPWTTE